MKKISSLFFAIFPLAAPLASAQIVYDGFDGPGNGRHIVLIAGDEEYRTEESMPMLGQILAKKYGFKCTVIFSIDPETGFVDPNNQENLPGLDALNDADMMIIGTRFRNPPAEDMKHIDNFVHSGKPIMGLRTATHAFNFGKNTDHPYAHYGWKSEEWPGGFGQQVLGDTWVNHHGKHKVEGCRGIIDEENKDHPILKGVTDVFAESDVYGINKLTGDETILMYGQVTETLEPDSKPVAGEQNDPMMPVVWVKEFTGDKGKTSKVITTTMGASVDLDNEGLRRLVINAVLWALDLDVPEKADVDYVTPFNPTFYGNMKDKAYWPAKAIKPEDFALPAN
ncbi:MAG: ThuA domain-containing protein [Verrucomicrobiota bacterium]